MYDADKAPDPSEWLERDEDERIIAVEDYHRRIGDDAPNELLHATFHVVVENQLAGGEDVVVETMRRLRDEGLTRHD
ncbi:MAG: hypothetical protein GWN71_03810, partial [Gammaproteobacteria bacterium]|nr:hypothetical protein [Gammaproteobacteria bacterium]